MISKQFFVFITFSIVNQAMGKCRQSPTEASGSVADPGPFCSGDLIFEENFDFFDANIWEHEVNIDGGGNNELQWYVSDEENCYVNNGILHIKPTLTSDKFGEDFLTSGTIDIGDECTSSRPNGCSRTGTPDDILNPIRSARIRSINSFSFKYGRVEIRAKIPTGNWLWPAIWMLPTDNVYGVWPKSGEIDILESRGNPDLSLWGKQIGVERLSATLNYGLSESEPNGIASLSSKRNSAPGQGYNLDFHNYRLEWAADHITFKVDEDEIGTVTVGDGFWKLGGFGAHFPDSANVWTKGGVNAPFDEQFHFLINLAVEGNFFPVQAISPQGEPWVNSSHLMTNFWNAHDGWLPTWSYGKSDDSHLQIDYIRVWAL